MDNTRTVSGFGKTVAAQEYVLVDEHARTLAILSATQGKPALTFYNCKGQLRPWFTVTAEVRPDTRFFDDSGTEICRYNADGGVDGNMAGPEVAKRNGGKHYAG